MYQGKVAVITGGAGGIGHGIALACLKEGMKIVIASRTESSLSAMADNLRSECPGAEIHIKTCDVSSEESVRELLDDTMKTYGHVNFLFNNAGIMYPRSFENLTRKDWEKSLNINVFGVINGMKVFLPELKKNEDIAYIINTGALGAVSFNTAMSHYCATKAATLLLSGCLLKELRFEGSKVNVMEVLPATVFSNLLKTSDNKNEEGLNEMEKAMKVFLYNATAGTTPEERKIAEEQYGTITNEEAGEIIMQAIRDGKNFCFTHKRAAAAAENFSKMMLDGYLK